MRATILATLLGALACLPTGFAFAEEPKLVGVWGSGLTGLFARPRGGYGGRRDL